MGGYRIEVVESKLLKQKWHVRLVSSVNGQKIMWSEKYEDRDHAVTLATNLAEIMKVELRFVER